MSMLTKDDLKEIQKIVKTEVKTAVKVEITPFRKEMEDQVNSIVKAAIDPFREEMLHETSLLAMDIKEVKNGVDVLKRGLKKIAKDQKVIISRFDTEYTELRTRVKRVEVHLNLKAS